MWVLVVCASIDGLLADAWKRQHLAPVVAADDATFIRRATLDLHGVIPRGEAVLAYVDSTDPDKRNKLIAALVAEPAFDAHMVDLLDDWWMTRAGKNKKIDRAAFRAFLAKAMSERWPYDRIVKALLTAEGDAANWRATFTGDVADLAGTTSRAFLGIQIQCAQCHDHVSEKWKQDDFRRFAAYFTAGIKKKKLDPDIAKATPTALDGTHPAAIADWVVTTPLFTRATANRFWAYFMGRGLFEPFDDWRDKAPPVMPEVLEALAKDAGDLRVLATRICTSVAYLRATAVHDAGDPQNAYFTRFNLKPLDSQQLFASLVRATGAEADDATLDRFEKQLDFAFDVDDEASSIRVRDPTMAQALLLMNGKLLAKGIRLWSKALKDQEPDQRTTLAYLRALGRKPHAAELAMARTQPPDTLVAALLMSAEFAFNH